MKSAVLVVVVVVGLIGCRELGPGETRCTNVYGTLHCKSGPPHPQTVNVNPAPAQRRPVYWCTTRESDGLGTCAATPGNCEVFRAEQNKSAPGSDENWGACVSLPSAICARSGCFTTPAACATSERFAGRSGAECLQR